MTIYDRIRLRREELGMSQQELANKIGYKSRSAVNKIESGLRDIKSDKIKAIAIALNTTPAYLMGWSNVAPEKPATNDSGEPLEDCIVLHRDGKTSRYKFTREQLDAMAEMIKKFGEEKTDL